MNSCFRIYLTIKFCRKNCLFRRLSVQASGCAYIEKNIVYYAVGGIESFGSDTFIVDAMPDSIADVPAETVIPEMAAELEEAGNKRGREKWKEDIIARAASRSAVRVKSAFTDEALRSILCRLASCEMPYTNPYGRPTMIFTSEKELKRRFGKT